MRSIRTTNPDDPPIQVNALVIQATIARKLGVANQAVGNWITRTPAYLRGQPGVTPIRFPSPAVTIDGVEFWHWPTVRDWAIRSGKITE